MVAATSSTSSATAASTTDDDDDHNVIGDVVAVSDESGDGACGSGGGDVDAPVACGSWVLAVAATSASMASCAGLHRRPSYTCTPFPYRRHYAVRRKNGVLLPR
jgi:hypothetical protein